MREIQASDAKARLAQLLDEVERGETVVITRHGRAIARLVPEGDRTSAENRKLIEEIEKFRRAGPGIPLEELLSSRHEGHKY
jgi:prevent-host-death family protein